MERVLLKKNLTRTQIICKYTVQYLFVNTVKKNILPSQRVYGLSHPWSCYGCLLELTKSKLLYTVLK